MFGEKTAFTNETVFNEIIENERIVFTYSMARNGVRFSVSLATVENDWAYAKSWLRLQISDSE